MSSLIDYDDLEFDVSSFFDGKRDHSFDELARRIFAWQFSNNAPYAAYCRSLGVESVQRWEDIPPVPTDAFKIESQPLVTCPLDDCSYCFHTSGTTGTVSGKHYMRNGILYTCSIRQCWKHAGLPALPSLSLPTGRAYADVHSSLGHMFMVLGAEEMLDSWDYPEDIARLGKEPVMLMGTALSFLHLMESDTEIPKLPEGSWLMETGGYKGTQRSLTKPELYTQLSARFDVPPERIINEYSMTELSSQFYTTGLGNPHKGPPWTRVRIIDPASGNEVAEGETGCIVIYDLANVDSVMAIQTQDLAVRLAADSFDLLGRDPSALPRGCSLTADEFFNKK